MIDCPYAFSNSAIGLLHGPSVDNISIKSDDCQYKTDEIEIRTHSTHKCTRITERVVGGKPKAPFHADRETSRRLETGEMANVLNEEKKTLSILEGTCR